MNNRLIDLYGHTVGILYKGPKHMVVLFQEDNSDRVVCHVPSENMMYHYLERDKKYHLQVELNGTVRDLYDGKKFHRNNLIVKKAEIL